MKKELYIAPEVEILCFMPVETLADNWGWTTWGARAGEEDTGESIVIPETGAPADGEE